MTKKILFSCILVFGITALLTAQYSQKLALLKYNGGGDWYSNPTALVNLALYSNQNLNTSIDPEYEVVEVGSSDIFNYPFIHMTGHGNVIFSEAEARNLRSYLQSGGFIHIDDNYGMDKFIRPELKKVFPNSELAPIPPSHQIFAQHYAFPDGLPKIHEHDNKPPEAYGIFIDGRLTLLYTFESDLSDGWEDEEVHNDPPQVREQALQMGANILQYVLNGEVKP
ncbi:DUF4159 domain-containing protein [Owenweeksia hongkongensis]|uniref:DUF4159 domain-containing protein n=1 Tax=Owenweeksia hongkongensis TaxID=253245 RepID=UPI003A957DAA